MKNPPITRSFPSCDFCRTYATLAALIIVIGGSPVAQGQAPVISNQSAEKKNPDEVVKLEAFSVSSTQDKGYRAGNSVSGTRIDMAIKDLPFSINAFTSQFIQDIGARDLGDIVQYAPGVTSGAKQIVNANASYMIRGFQQAPQINGFATPNSSNTGGPFVDTSTVERVEVVKGPASLLYGQVAPGGTVNYITKHAEEKPFTSLSAKASSYSYWRSTADINQPLIAKALMFRINAAYEHGYQYVDNEKSNTTVVAPNFIWNVGDRFSVKIDYQDFRRRENAPNEFLPQIEIVAAAPASGILGTAGVLQNALDLSDPGFLYYYPLPRKFNLVSRNDWRHSHFQTFMAETDAKLGSHWVSRANFSWSKGYIGFKQTGLTSINIDVPTKYTSQYSTYKLAAAAFAADILKDPNVALTAPHAQLPRRQVLREALRSSRATQLEASGHYEIEGIKIRPLVGAYYDSATAYDRRRQTGTNGTYTLFTAPSAAARVTALPNWDFVNPTAFPIDYNTDFNPVALPLTTYTGSFSHNRAVYGLLNTSYLNDRLTFIGGARYNKTDTKITNFLSDPSVYNPVSPTFSPVYQVHKVTPQVAGGFKIRRDVLVYASYSESYQANTFLKAGDLPGTTAKPTTSKGYEGGIKTDLFGGRISSTVSVYDVEQRDRIISLNVASPTGAIGSFDFQGNVDRSRGIETEITFSPVDNWQVYLSVAENDVRTTSVRSGLEVYLGTHPQSTAKTLANLWTRYSFTTDSLKGLWVGTGFNYTSKKQGIVTNAAIFLPAATIYNAAVGYDWKWDDKPMTALVNWDNITDRVYFPTIQERGLPARISLTVSAKL